MQTPVKYECYKNGIFSMVDSTDSPKTFKRLKGFLSCNQARDCFSKFQGFVWMINKAGAWVKVCRNIPDLTYQEYLDLQKS